MCSSDLLGREGEGGVAGEAQGESSEWRWVREVWEREGEAWGEAGGGGPGRVDVGRDGVRGSEIEGESKSG